MNWIIVVIVWIAFSVADYILWSSFIWNSYGDVLGWTRKDRRRSVVLSLFGPASLAATLLYYMMDRPKGAIPLVLSFTIHRGNQ